VRAQGGNASSLVLQTLYPVPEAAICDALEGIRKVVVPEMNMGQYVLEIERIALDEVEVIGVGKMNTTLISPQEIIERGGLL
jgi:2-oxoglutarate ferredoxin oxidoreductase subunit alpha